VEFFGRIFFAPFVIPLVIICTSQYHNLYFSELPFILPLRYFFLDVLLLFLCTTRRTMYYPKIIKCSTQCLTCVLRDNYFSCTSNNNRRVLLKPCQLNSLSTQRLCTSQILIFDLKNSTMYFPKVIKCTFSK
jgi:hypothetical protein